MAKDSYWFKHDSTAGRGTRMRKIQFIHGHWGKGVYWDVIEVLREQDGYCYETDETSLQMLADLIGVKDPNKFITWFNDCLRFELFLVKEKYFYSEILTENMQNWEIKKLNGNQGGRPKKKPNQNRNHNLNETETITETKANRNLNGNRNETIREEKSIEDKIREDNKKTINSFQGKNLAALNKFIPPTVEQVRIYCVEINSSVSPEKFIAYYTSNGWMVGKNKMMDWKAAIVTWQNSDFNKSKTAANGLIKIKIESVNGGSPTYEDATEDRVRQLENNSFFNVVRLS